MRKERCRSRQDQPTRGERLRGYLVWKGFSSARLCSLFGVGEARVSRILHEDRAPIRYIEIMRDQCGAPVELLPAPTRGVLGPAPGAQAQVNPSA